MFLTPYQHGVVREIVEHGKFDSTNPQFQNYQYAVHDLAELVVAGMIVKEYELTSSTYLPGTKFDGRFH